MSAIAQIHLQPPLLAPWHHLVGQMVSWADDAQIDLRDAVLLLPFAQLIAPCRAAFAARGGWMPRIDTTQTLAQSLGPAAALTVEQIHFDVAIDQAMARRLLARQPWARGGLVQDPRGFEQAAAAVVHTAQQMSRAAAAVPPGQRAAYWQEARQWLVPPAAASGLPGGRERQLARLALDWAERSAPPPTDALHGLRPSAWLIVQAGGPDPLSQQLARAAATTPIPVLWLDTDADPDDPFKSLPTPLRLQLAECADFESEAQQSAARVLQHLAAGEVPVALIAQDRLLVRRVHALLARQDIAVHDETGWKLSTTRAGASLRRLITCAGPEASTDDWLDWLKTCAGAGRATPGPLDDLDRLEQALRDLGLRRADAVRAAELAHGAALWRLAQSHLHALASPPAQALSQWLGALETALEGFGLRRQLDTDDAGRQVLRALHVGASGLASAQAPWRQAPEPLDTTEFGDWVDAVLEATLFQPEVPLDAQVVICPLGRAMLRPFQAVVLPGTDARHLGAAPAANGLLSDPEWRRLGLPGRAEQRDSERLALAQLLRLPRVSVLRRRVDDGDAVAPSPLLEWLLLEAQRQRGVELSTALDGRRRVPLVAAPVAHPLPVAPDRFPPALSASACEALRACPYRFFALRMLRLKSGEELDGALGKREYGRWLHAVLEQFHLQRSEPSTIEEEAARLHQLASQETARRRLDEVDFMPFEASFDRLVPRYLEWLHERDQRGVSWQQAELRLQTQPPQWDGVVMSGVIDRVDQWHAAAERAVQLIDYKTGQPAPLQDAIRQHEDTQLAYYAALMRAQPGSPALPLRASYLMLDDAKKILEIEHPEVEDSAQRLIQGLGAEIARIRAGAPLPALGEGRSCEFCEARGLCRRDHWADPPDEGVP